MPAPTAADVARATRPATIITAESATVLARQPGARDQLASPRAGFWDAAADASAVLAEAQALIGVERRRFSVTAVNMPALAVATVTPTVQLIDAGLAANMAALVSRIAIDDETETTALEVMG